MTYVNLYESINVGQNVASGRDSASYMELCFDANVRRRLSSFVVRLESCRLLLPILLLVRSHLVKQKVVVFLALALQVGD